MNLEELLRATAAKGELNHVSLIFTMRGRVPLFSATYAPASKYGHHTHEDPDPVKAIVGAITGFKRAASGKAIPPKMKTTDEDDFG